VRDAVPTRPEVLRRVRCRPRTRPAKRHPRLARALHAEAPRREDPDVARLPRGGAQAGHRPVRGHQGLARAPGGPRPGRSSQGARSDPGADDGGGAPLRGHREPGHGRRHHGDLRGAGRPRGPRDPRLLRGAPHAGPDRAVRPGDPGAGGPVRPGADRHQLGRGRRPLHRQRPAHGLHRRGADDPPGRTHGADRHARIHPDDSRFAPARRGVRAGRTDRPRPGQGAPGPRRGLRAHGRQPHPLAVPGRRRAGPDALRGPQRRAGPPARRAGARRPGPGADRRDGRRGGGGQVPPPARVRALAPDRRLAGARVALGLLRAGDALSPAHRAPAQLLQAGGPRQRARDPGAGDRQAHDARPGPAGRDPAGAGPARRALRGPSVQLAGRGAAPPAHLSGHRPAARERAAPSRPGRGGGRPPRASSR
jgi:hypothetical protein